MKFRGFIGEDLANKIIEGEDLKDALSKLGYNVETIVRSNGKWVGRTTDGQRFAYVAHHDSHFHKTVENRIPNWSRRRNPSPRWH